MERAPVSSQPRAVVRGGDTGPSAGRVLLSLVTSLPQRAWLQDGLTVPSLHAGFCAERGSQTRAPGKGVCRHRPLWALPSPPGQCGSPRSSPRPLPRRDWAIRHQLQEAAGVASETVACFFLPVNLGFRNEPRVGQPPTPGSSPGTSGPSPTPQSTRIGHLLGRGAGTVSTHICLRVRHWGQWGSRWRTGLWEGVRCSLGALDLQTGGLPCRTLKARPPWCLDSHPAVTPPCNDPPPEVTPLPAVTSAPRGDSPP